MRSVADLLASRACIVTHWHRLVEGVFPAAASLPQLCCRFMPTLLRRPTPMELAELVAGTTIRRRLRGKQSTQRRLTGKQPPLSGNRPQSMETVPEVEEHPAMPTETEPWRPMTEAEKTAWDALSPEEREVCDALVHRLHRELGHSDIRGMVDSLRQHHAHPTVLAAAKLMQCTACQESARLKSRPVSSGKIMEPGAVLQMALHEGGACQRHTFDGRILGSSRGPDLENCTPSGASWKCIVVGSDRCCKNRGSCSMDARKQS